MAMSSNASEKVPHLIAREMALGFGVVSLVVVATCAFLLALVQQVSGLVMGMREDEIAIRHANELATTVREQYIHIARSLIESDCSHVERYAESQARVREGVREISAHVPAGERWRIAALEAKTEELADRFSSCTSHTLDTGDRAEAIADRRAIANLAEDSSALADALALTVSSHMSHAHVLATDSTRRALIGGASGVLLVVALSVGFTLRFRRAVIKPLSVLTSAARRFGAGDFSARVGAVGRGELQAVAQAFDRMAEELAERERRLVHNERMAAIGHLAAGVAHELNNPIGIIRGYLKTMTVKDDPVTLGEELQILDEEAAQCQRIAEDLLAYARPLELRRERVRMKPFLEETLRRFRESPVARGAHIDVEAGEGDLACDPARLRQVILNLVLNAVQVSPEGAAISVAGRAAEREYVIEVADRGPGIPVEDHGRIFEPFYSKRKGGSGLGLSVCQGIVQAHGGRVTVHSREGEGASFCVVLPVESATQSPGGSV